MEQYLADEILTGDEQGTCKHCKCKTDIIQTTSLNHLPKHLIMTLNLFRYDADLEDSKKLDLKVSVEEIISIQSAGQAIFFLLYGAIIHSGYTTTSGHYVSATQKNGAWFLQNDARVNPYSLQQIKDMKYPASPYVLFYKAIEDENEFAMENYRPNSS